MTTTTSPAFEKSIEKLLSKNKFCSFGTIDGDKPKVRYMALFHEGLKLYLATNSKTDKVEEIQQNRNVHVLIGFDGKPSSDIAQIQAKAEICSDQELKERLWKDSFDDWFSGPHDPEYVILVLTPERIEYTIDKETKVWTP